jgi:hypothetical protein
MMTLTPNLALEKLDYRDIDYPDWGTVENKNMDILDLAYGTLIYTEENYITSSSPPPPATPITVVESQSESLDNLDIVLESVAILMPTGDQKGALICEGGVPDATHKYVTKSYVRMDRKRVLFPEEAGSVVTPSPGGANLGNMTTATETSGNYIYNYYKWLSSEVTFQNYDISIQWRVPEPFLGFRTTAFKALIVDIATEMASDVNNYVDVIIQKDGIATTFSSTHNFSSVGTNWYSEREGNELIGFDSTNPILASLVAGNTLDITIRVYSQNSKYAKVGAVTIQYIG